MRKLIVFNQISLDGYFAGVNGDISWHGKNNDDPEWNAFGAENSKGGGTLVFGRITYEMMAGFWTSPQGRELNATVAEQMTALPKIVFSRIMDKPSWANTTLVKGDIAQEMRKLKAEEGKDMCILGSGQIVAQMAQEKLIDVYQMVAVPVVLGQGRTMFEGMKDRLPMKLVTTRAFPNGNVFLSYEAL